MGAAGFLNLPLWHDELKKILSAYGVAELIAAPALGKEEAEHLWASLEEEDFFSAVEIGWHFSQRPNPSRWPKWVITSDPALATEKILMSPCDNIGFRGAIGGTFPILDICTPRELFPRPKRLLTVADGISSFILSEMEQTGKSLDEAQSEIQWRNLAPSNMTRHTHGLIARERLALLGSLIFGKALKINEIFVEGFGKIDPRDIKIAKTLNFSVRLIGSVEQRENGIEAWVRPCLIPQKYLLAQAKGGMESAYLQCDADNSFIYTGPGTDNEVVLRGMLRDFKSLVRHGSLGYATLKPADILPKDEIFSSFFLRISIMNFSSTVGQIINLFAEKGIEVRNIFQPGKNLEKGDSAESNGEIVFFTKPNFESAMRKTTEAIGSEIKLATVRSCIRYEV